VTTERSIVVTVDALGGLGDGVGTHDGAKLIVPYVLPGEVVAAQMTGSRRGVQRSRLKSVIEASRHRVEPACRYFGKCGGCSLQHADRDFYRQWKRSRLETALSRQGFRDVEILPLHDGAPGRRRRTEMLATMTTGGDLRFGFRRRASHQVIDIAACPLLKPVLADTATRLRPMLVDMLRPREDLSVAMTATEGGVDMVLSLPRIPDLAGREALAGIAEALDLARLAIMLPKQAEAELVAARRPPEIDFAGIRVVPPSGAFLQADAAAEAAMMVAMSPLLTDKARVLDLYCGCGTFSLAAARTAAVHAVDSAPDQIAALETAARRAGLDRLTTAVRDLERRPFQVAELAGFDAVIMDPPRAGAAAQSAVLAQSDVQTVIAVSCNPATFARDARTLVDGGYVLRWALPIDQFLWSPHLEVLAQFERLAP